MWILEVLNLRFTNQFSSPKSRASAADVYGDKYCYTFALSASPIVLIISHKTLSWNYEGGH